VNAKSFAFKKLQYRAYLSAPLQDLLMEQGFPLDEVESLIEELKQQGYLDDRSYIESIIRREKRARHGPIWVRQKLRALGADAVLIEEILEEQYSEEERLEAIGHLLEKKANKEKKNAIASIQRRGFDISEILKVCYNNN
jgi:regulatory protein